MRKILFIILLLATFATNATPAELAYASELNCMARNIYYEARGESRRGMIAVGQVTMNRVQSGQWGGNVCSVVKARGQFSWVSRGRFRARLKGVQWEASQMAAWSVLQGERLASVGRAMYYHNRHVHPRWKLHRVASIGHHLFYS